MPSFTATVTRAIALADASCITMHSQLRNRDEFATTVRKHNNVLFLVAGCLQPLESD